MKRMKEIYFAGGCFWGTEHFLKQINGVVYTEVGYANGNENIKNPTYELVCTGKTNFVETVCVKYDTEKVDLPFLIDLFFMTINPTSLNKQGNDRGTQYRTGIYYTDEKDEAVIKEKISSLSVNYAKPIVVEVESLRKFYPAEKYHQDYLDKNPTGYCHISPKLFEIAKKAKKDTISRFKRKSKTELKKLLSRLEYEVTQNSATEPSFNNRYWNEYRKGIYVDITTGEPLFSSSDKFDSGCGWPAFSKPINQELIEDKTDHSHGMTRQEVRSKTGNAHLGHVFDDGPKDKGGLRYCINSASLKFIPLEDMKKMGYEEYIKFVK